MWILVSLLILSVTFSGALFWFNRIIIREKVLIEEDIQFLEELLSGYEKHLKRVYKLEMFYGDATLESLMKHTAKFRKELKEFQEVYFLEEEDDEVKYK